MNVSDLTDDNIGQSFWVKGTLSANWQRVTFEGLTSKPGSDRDSESNGGPAYWMILMCSPAQGVMHFRTPSGKYFTGLLVRANAEVYPVEVLYGVSQDGSIVELGEIAA